MTVPLPRKVKAGRTYRITDDLRTIPGAAGDVDGYAGHTWHAESVVFIRSELSDALRRETLLHELMHVAINTSGAERAVAQAALIPKGDGGDGPEETYVCVISERLLVILDENPAVRRYLWP